MTDRSSAVCAEIQGCLSAYIDARLSTTELAEIRGHLADCTPCSDERRALEATDALVEEALSDHPFGDAFVEELITGLPVTRIEARPIAAGRRLRPAGAGLALLAAGLLLGLGLALTHEPSVRSQPVLRAPEVVAQAGTGLMILTASGSPRTLARGEAIRSGDRLLAVTTPASVWLSDGSRVDLHADTEARLRADSDGGLTVVVASAEGKVFCDVAKRQHPFRVKTRDLEVRVLGTQFLVDQRRASSGVIVIRGKVLAGTQTDRRTLTVGDQAEAYQSAGAGRLSLSRVTPRRHGLWVPSLAREQRELDAQETASQPAVPADPAPSEPSPPAAPPAEPSAGLDQPVVPPQLNRD